MSTSPSLIDAIEQKQLSPSFLDRLNDRDFTVLETQLYDELDAKCGSSPLYWGQNWTFTENPKWKEQGLTWREKFPTKGYFVPLFEAFQTHKRLFVPKTREMMTSWCAMLWATHQAQWHQAEVIVQADAEDKADELIGYAGCLYRNQAEWLLERHPLISTGNRELKWASGGRVFGIPHGEHKIRLFHPTIYIMDEASFLREAQQCYDAAEPVAGQIVAVSSAGPGWFGDQVAR
jgi:hypothetical protein